MTNQAGLSALVLGASGLVGKALISKLLDDNRYASVRCLLRRPMAANHAKLEPVVIDFERLQEYEGYFKVDHLYICLGTTINEAGSKAAFRKVDFDYVHIAAQLARAQRVKSLVWISSVGADPKSNNFYLRTKGELESAIFSMPGLMDASAVRPSLLVGERTKHRRMESMAIALLQPLSWLMLGPLQKYRPVKAEEVADKMISLQKF
ncbi:NAD-dependent epimerase/dehydratase family protein [Aliiglaciecola sp. CAU 1673]|uniref:NAD-dependent epimerase/dehydratase family protein n=1 Tax=Aliiglaciecola sp. CAU 1673 TaxID=3032595 RepID=UPI0023DCCA83|nr:NAD-dependent epimerase/dehydratase family protein [Aliiglaciecola sp. CAU 1673]MDF2176835.1 NAD-dependent epimerase/dehydratase family protein [Aliiglaciecola sp. CAU 1673]